VINLVKERMTYLQDFWEQAAFFFATPAQYDLDSVKPKWTDIKTDYFNKLIDTYKSVSPDQWNPESLEITFKALAEESNLKIGEVMLPFRIMLVGGKFGPAVFDIAALLGKEETAIRIQKALAEFSS
jgi:glutamyl-tRNA synthetase